MLPSPSQTRLTPHQPSHNLRLSSPVSHPLKRSRTPYDEDTNGSSSQVVMMDRESAAEDARKARLDDMFSRTEQKLSSLFEKKQDLFGGAQNAQHDNQLDSLQPEEPKPPPPPKRAARAIAEDDYGDEEDEEEDAEDVPAAPVSPLSNRNIPTTKVNGVPTTPTLGPSLTRISTTASSSDTGKSSEEARKQLEEEKKALEDAAKRSFITFFYTLENDRHAMLEQERLDELDRQVEAEAASEEAAAATGGDDHDGATPKQGTLSSANLGATSLNFRHLIGIIDRNRSVVRGTDGQIRNLMGDVKKGRSKWAHEDRVGQDELYDAAERVLMDLKAHTEYSAPFLQKVNKRDAPDYYTIIKQPMDIGTMFKKLKNLQYQSKKDVCDDLSLIWMNCLRYNANPEHPLRKKAEHLKKETAKLTPLIPDIVIKSRAEFEREERRMQTEFDDGEESDDEPLKTTRGRKAPGKSSKKGASAARKAPPTEDDSATAPDEKTKDATGNLKTDNVKSDVNIALDASLLGFSTPPRGDTPALLNGAASQAEPSEIDPADASVLGATQMEDADQEDEEYKAWKQVTKRDRANYAAARHRLFKADKLNLDEPALLRSKAAMRRWMRIQKSLIPDNEDGPSITGAKPDGKEGAATTLQEEIDDADESVLPDYYDPLSAVPHLNDTISWKEDVDGQVIEQREDCLRVVPSGYFTSPHGQLATKIEANMKQMQDTRKIVAKIAIVKQMQVQTQTYQNQFQKYEPEPFVEADIPPTVISDDGPIMHPIVSRAALRRTVGKIFYHAGFEEFQPSALDAVTEIASHYFADLAHTLTTYAETVPKVYKSTPVPAPSSSASKTLATIPTTLLARTLQPRFSQEEAILHTLQTYGQDLDSLEYYIKDELDRLSTKLEAHHTRTRDYLAELLRPALDPTTVGQDGAGAFTDGSEQFVGGDFAEDIDEDFFGFRELGLDKEFGLAGLSVPLHLLQSRIQTQNPGANAISASTAVVMETPEAYPPVTYETLSQQIGIVQEFFRKKLDILAAGKNDDEREDVQLVEDDELPVKQRFPKPRLPPTGKISSPRKRPIREQQMMARKKRRLEIEAQREKERQATTGSGVDEGNGDATASGMVNGGDSAGPDMVTGANEHDITADGDTSMLDVNGDDTSPTTSLTADASALALKGNNKLKPVSKLKFEVSQDDVGVDDAPKGDPAKPALQKKSSTAGSRNNNQDNEDDAGPGQGQGMNGVLSPIAAH